jgi:hypothetical protein
MTTKVFRAAGLLRSFQAFLKINRSFEIKISKFSGILEAFRNFGHFLDF